jgi:transcriptional regulator with GAF, ATPase, and Fis domain
MINIEKLHEIGLLLKKKLDDSIIFESIFDVVFEAIPFDYGTLFINSISENQLSPVYSKNKIIVDLASNFDVGKGQGIAGWVSDNTNPIIFSHFTNENPQRKFNSFVSIPLVIDEKLIGVLNLGQIKSGYFTENDKKELTLLGGQVAIIIDKFNLKKEIIVQKQILENTIEKLKLTEERLIIKEKFATMGEDVEKLNKEINNPLSIIMGFSELLLQKCTNNSIKNELLVDKLNIILESARKINTILHRNNN